MRQFAGLKPGLALEMTAFGGTPKMFRSRFRDSVDDGVHKLYSARRIREIRMQLMNIPFDTARPRQLPPLLNFRMPKGGVGKTSLSANVAAALALQGYKVLVIDGDPQASMTVLFGVDWVESDITHIGHLMKRVAANEPVEAAVAVVSLYEGGMLDLIPADITMANDQWMINTLNSAELFKRLLSQEVEFFSQYDAIIIDSAPGSSLLATSFMVATDTIMAVITPEGDSLVALDVLASNVEEINRAFGRTSNPLDARIVVNQYHQSKKPHGIMMGKLWQKYPGKLLDSVVKDFVGFLRQVDPDNIPANGPLMEKEPSSVGARDIITLSQEIVRVYGIQLAGYNPIM